MKLLLKKDVEHLGIVGDVVDVKAGYARNYLLPYGLGTEPTETNMRALAEERKKAEARRSALREHRRELAEKLREIEVTITAAANEDGVLYGSVGPREISVALREEGYAVDAKNISLHAPIRRLDNITVPVKLGEDIDSEVKVWVVRARAEDQEAEEGEQEHRPADQ